MKKFVVPVTWQVSSYVVIEAETADEAAEQAETVDLDLIPDPEYVEDSFEADFECVEEVKHCLAHGDEVFWNDPDTSTESCSGKAIFKRYRGNDIAYIEKDGVEMECYVDELS